MSLYKGNNLISGAIPNSANQSLSNLDSAGQDKFDAKVNKAGDTMTGTLSIDTDGTNLNFNNPNLTKGTNPSSTKYLGILMNDGSNSSSWQAKRLGMIEHSVDSNGNSILQIAAIQNVANSQTKALLQLNMTQAGVASCTFPNTTCCDCQWVTLNQTLISSDTSLNGSTTLNYTVNVPNDGHQYMIIVRGQLRSTNTKGNWGQLEINTGFGSFIMSHMKSEIAENNDMTTTVTVPINKVRTLRVIRNTSFHANCRNLTVVAYRRIGTNS